MKTFTILLQSRIDTFEEKIREMNSDILILQLLKIKTELFFCEATTAMRDSQGHARKFKNFYFRLFNCFGFLLT